jgi:hypothetical protein
LLRLLCAVLGCAFLLPAAARADAGVPASSDLVVPISGVSPAALADQQQAGATIATWSRTISSLGKTYKVTMVGTNPFVAENFPITLMPTDLISIRLEFSNGVALSPKLVDSACSPSGTADGLALKSPLFQNHAYGSNVGDVQYIDAFLRENFAKYTIGSNALNSDYHIQLDVKNRATVDVTVPAADGSATLNTNCGDEGKLNISWWESYVTNTLLPQLSGYLTPQHFAIFLFYRTSMYRPPAGAGAIGGYHTAVANPAFGGTVQTYATADYKPSNDIAPLSHEIGEWLDDPFVSNGVPKWGHIGQQSGCQGNLEVGDPLSGTTVPVTMPNGYTYHPQELAFFSWFFRQDPSIGLHGWYSSNGTFTSDAGSVCT